MTNVCYDNVIRQHGGDGMYDISVALGGKKALGKSADKAGDYNAIIQSGISVEAGNHFKDLLHLTDKEFSKVLGISERSFHRKKGAKAKLSVNASDRLYRFARIFSYAVEVIGSEDNARKWLLAPHFSFEGKTPLEMLKTDAGAKDVEVVLAAIRYGAPL